jgi:ubiquitin-protein ligase
MWDSRIERLQRDLESMEGLRRQLGGMLDFSVSSDLERYVVRVDGVPGMKGTTVGNKVITDSFVFTIELPAEYSYLPPIVTFEEPLFHPNCWFWGVLCFESTPRTSLRDLIIDVVKCINYQIVNLQSIANPEAGQWYLENEPRLRKVIKKVKFPPDPDKGPSPDEGLIIYNGCPDKLIIKEVTNAQ